MKNVLKAWLIKNRLTKNSTELYAQVSSEGKVGVTEIVDEIMKDGLDINREQVLDIINRFNQKSAEMVVTGHNVNTGLVRMRPIIKGSFYNHDWNPNINWIDVTLMHGSVLSAAISNTTVQIIGEQVGVAEGAFVSEPTSQLIARDLHANVTRTMEKSENEIDNIPACGIAFRQWLFKS
ncbi:MAG: DNA-binding domain-containing protein [Paludibacter sp.]|nr:DNA-binding domain-containing protein [Paludibacter sp.]